MAAENDHSKEMSLVLSSDAKPRLKWNLELHQRFIDAVNQLGGAEKATPKSLMRIMGIHGLTLYHLKSHLQKYRLGKSHRSQAHDQKKQEEHREKRRSEFASKTCDGAESQINESLQITQALEMQMEAQKKLHEQIEVQRHLQRRIESQGKYLQSVLIKAQETLSQYSSCSIEVERAKAQLTQLVSMVDSGCPSSSLSDLTESEEASILQHESNNVLGNNICSLESSLTSSESSWRNEEAKSKHENEEKDKEMRNSIDLNSKLLDEFDSGPKMIDLNSNGVGF